MDLILLGVIGVKIARLIMRPFPSSLLFSSAKQQMEL